MMHGPIDCDKRSAQEYWAKMAISCRYCYAWEACVGRCKDGKGGVNEQPRLPLPLSEVGDPSIALASANFSTNKE